MNTEFLNSITAGTCEKYSLGQNQLYQDKIRKAAGGSVEFRGEQAMRNVFRMLNNVLGSNMEVEFSANMKDDDINIAFLCGLLQADGYHTFEMLKNTSKVEFSSLRWIQKYGYWKLIVFIKSNNEDKDEAFKNILYLKEKQDVLYGEDKVAAILKPLGLLKNAYTDKLNAEEICCYDENDFVTSGEPLDKEELKKMARNYHKRDEYGFSYNDPVVEPIVEETIVETEEEVIVPEEKKEEVIVPETVIEEKKEVKVVEKPKTVNKIVLEADNYKPFSIMDIASGKVVAPKVKVMYTSEDEIHPEECDLDRITDEIIASLSYADRKIMCIRAVDKYATGDGDDYIISGNVQRTRYGMELLAIDEDEDEEQNFTPGLTMPDFDDDEE